jgi:hypothetical protein
MLVAAQLGATEPQLQRSSPYAFAARSSAQLKENVPPRENILGETAAPESLGPP